MKQKKLKENMTVVELARMTTIAFTDFEIRVRAGFQEMRHEMQAGFQEIRRDFQIDLRETESRLIDAINGIEVRRPEFDALKGDVEDLSGRVEFLEKEP